MTYPPAFEVLWLVRTGIPNAAGSKKRAFAQWDKLKPIEQGALVVNLHRQKEEKEYARKVDGFAPAFPHLERWIRDRRWDEKFAWNGSGTNTLLENHSYPWHAQSMARRKVLSREEWEAEGWTDFDDDGVPRAAREMK